MPLYKCTRPHWDDDLIRSVHRVSPVSMLMPPNDVYAIIAAVEDWMDANDNPLPHVLNECLQWLDAERAAIQRVRELADTWMSDGAAWGPYSARCILDALDGGAE